MNLLKVYEFTLGELNKREAPSLLLSDFNYFLNKAVQQYSNKIYNVFEMSQQQTDDLRVLKAEETLDLTNNTASLPLIYRHMLSCTVNFRVLKNYSCFTAGTILSYGAGRMTTDMQTLIRQNHYFKPTYFRPYYYITKDKIIIYADKESIFLPISINIEYLRTPQKLELTQTHLDLDEDDESIPLFGVSTTRVGTEEVILELPDYVQYEIINEIVKLAMENASDPRVQTHVGINQSIAGPGQGQK